MVRNSFQFVEIAIKDLEILYKITMYDFKLLQSYNKTVASNKNIISLQKYEIL